MSKREDYYFITLFYIKHSQEGVRVGLILFIYINMINIYIYIYTLRLKHFSEDGNH